MNPFEALAAQASEEKWCWNIRCTTCGHTHFRYAFRELARGKSPADQDWVVRKEKTHYKDKLGALPRKYSTKEKEYILALCSDVSLPTIADECTFPDWLGYLGLILHHMSSSSPAYEALSTAWAKQLLAMVHEPSSVADRLKAVAEGGDLLSLNDLEEVEKVMATT